MRGLNYFGTMDDEVTRFPWKFKVNQDQIDHSMASQVIDGHPILLNDGYLVNHPVSQAAILQKNNLLWNLIEIGFVKILVRGRDQYELEEMPERMSHIESFRRLIRDEVPGIEWKEFKSRLTIVGKKLKSEDKLVPWAKLHAGSGYLVIAKRLLAKNCKARSLGMERLITTATLHEFLRQFVGLMEKSLEAPRNQWRLLALNFADNRKYNVEDPDRFVLNLMRLANEIYHYNQGIMLASCNEEPVSVETQVSEAFDDLLITRDIVCESLPKFPLIYIPSAIRSVSPSTLASFLDPDTKIGRARQEWIVAKEKFHTNPEQESKFAREAARAYSEKICEAVKKEIKFSATEDFMKHVLGESSSGTRRLVAAGVGTAVYRMTDSETAGLLAFVGTGYALSQANKKVSGLVTDKYRIWRTKGELMNAELILRSKRAIQKIKSSRIPSSLTIDPTVAKQLSSEMISFA